MCVFLNDLFHGWLLERKYSRSKRKKASKVGGERLSSSGEGQKHNYGSNLGLHNLAFIYDDLELKSSTKVGQHTSSGPEKHSQTIVAHTRMVTMTDSSSSSQRQQSASNAAGPVKTAPEEEFRIRTDNRRHLDFVPDSRVDLHCTTQTKWSSAFHFIQAADSQFGMIDSYVHNRIEPGWKEEIELCESLVATCNRMDPKPRFMIICGDLVDAWPATDVRRRQVADFKKVFAKLDKSIPLVCVCGNHDVGDEPTMASIREYRQNFGEDYFCFTTDDVLFIVINSQFYKHREDVMDYACKQDEWLELMLSKCKLFKYSLVFEHIPWFLKDSDEEDDYFNISKTTRLLWLRKFKEAGVTKIFCGHYHRNAGGWFEGMEQVVTTAIGAQCGSDKSGVRIVKVLDEDIKHKYYAIQDIPTRIELS